MNEQIQSIDALLEKIAQKADYKESLEWYLSNQLNDYKKLLLTNPSALEIENSTRVLNRFCTESMDWDSELYKECCSITAKGTRLAKSAFIKVR